MNNTSFLDSISDKRLTTLSTRDTISTSHVTNRDAQSNSIAFSSPPRPQDLGFRKFEVVSY
jgi:hypothetical protein